MANNDGSLNFDTKIDSSGFQKGVEEIGGVAQKGLAVTGKVLGATATAVTTLGGAAIKVGSDFEAGMSQVQAVSGASGEELEKLKEKAKEMGASTKFSATESAEALNYMAMAGWKTEEMLGGIEGIMNLAAASGEDLATTSDIVTDALTAFGMSASDSTHFADILAAASSNANTNVSMMGETFKYVAPLAGSLGYSAEDTATAIGLMANAGIKGSQAGTSLRSTLTRLAKPTKESSDAMYLLGVSMTDDEGKMYSLMEVMEQIRNGFAGGRITQEEYTDSVARWKQMLAEGSVDMNQYSLAMESLDIALNGTTEAQQAEIAAMLGGQEAMSGLLAIVNASDADFEKLSGAINDCNGSAAEMAEIMQDNLQGQITILQSGLEGLGVSMYETMQDTAKDVVKEAQGMVQQLQDAFNEGGFEGLVGAFGDVLSQIVQWVAEAAPTIIDVAVNLVSSFCDGLRSAPGIGESGANLITALVSGLMFCVDEIWSTAIVLIGKLAGGIAAGAPQMVQSASDALTAIIECIVDWGPDLLQAGADIIVALAEGIADALPTLIYQVVIIVEEIAMALVDNLPAFVDAALQIIEGIVQGFVDGAPVLLDGAIQLFMAILEALPVVIEQLLQALPELIITITDFLTQNIPLIVEGAVQLLMGIIEAIPAIVAAIIENGPAIIEAIIYALVSAGPQVIEAAETLLNAIITPLKDIPNMVGSYLNGAIERIIQWGQDAQVKAQEAANSFVEEVVAFISELPEKLAYWLGYAIGTIIKWGLEFDSWVETEIPRIIENIVTFFSELPDKIWTWLVNTVTKLAAWKQQVNATAKEAISNMISSIISLLAQLPSKVTSELAKVTAGMVQWGLDIVNRMTEVGKNIVSGIWNGISSGWDWLLGKVKDLANSLLEGAKDALDIHSPSKRFDNEFGRWLMPGAIEGVKRSMPKALRDMKEQAGELLAVMQGTVNASRSEVALNAAGFGGARALTSAGTVVYNDNHQEQENNYHVPVVTPAETAKANREAFRKMAGGVK